MIRVLILRELKTSSKTKRSREDLLSTAFYNSESYSYIYNLKE